MFMKANISETVDEVDKFSEVIEERLVGLFYFLHWVWFVCNFDM